MKAVFKLSAKEIYRRVFCLLNSFQDNKDMLLTEGEIDILVEFMMLPRKKFEYQPFSTLAKNKVIAKMQEEKDWYISRENMNNKIYALVHKGYLWRDEDRVLYLKPHIKKLIDQIRKDLDINGRFIFPVEFRLNDETEDKAEVIPDNN